MVELHYEYNENFVEPNAKTNGGYRGLYNHLCLS
jgi:hypothetical protein